MGKKREKKRKKRPKANASIDEEKLARMEAVKSKREEIIAMVKLRLDKKLQERLSIAAANMREEELHRETIGDEIKSSNEMKMIEIREEMKKVMTAGIEKVHAAKILQEKIKFDPKSKTMNIFGKKYKLKRNVHIVGWGWDALMLATSFEKIIVDNVKKGFIVVPRRTIAMMSVYTEWFPSLNTRISLTEAASDVTPDDACVVATKNIADYCKRLKKNDILIVALSIAGNDLLCLPKGTIGFREKMKLLDELRAAGATNREIGVVRKTLSAVRGGDLARLAYPAKVISLVMSDTGPDDLNLGHIVDGPTIQKDLHAIESSAQSILEKYGLHAHDLSQSIREVLKDHESVGDISAVDTKKSDDDKLFKSVVNFVVASSKEALDEMAVRAFGLGYVPIKLTAAGFRGTATNGPSIQRISREYTKILSLLILAAENKITRTEMYVSMRSSKIFDLPETKILEIFPSKDKWARGLYLLICPPAIFENSSYSRTIGKTGINQELSLYFSLDWYLKSEQYPILKEYVVWFLGGASGGHDGNTKYSGAYGYGNLAVDVYRKFKMNLAKRNQTSDSSTRMLEDERLAIHESILPDRALAEGNANLLLCNVNDGAELLKIGNSNGYTYTNVGDLHIFRIARYQCSCDGLCGSRSSSRLPSGDR